jgi:hypothetical protein
MKLIWEKLSKTFVSLCVWRSRFGRRLSLLSGWSVVFAPVGVRYSPCMGLRPVSWGLLIPASSCAVRSLWLVHLRNYDVVARLQRILYLVRSKYIIIMQNDIDYINFSMKIIKVTVGSYSGPCSMDYGLPLLARIG